MIAQDRLLFYLALRRCGGVVEGADFLTYLQATIQETESVLLPNSE